MRAGFPFGVGLLAVAAALVAGPATAHHSYAPFDRSTPVTIEGEVERIEWTNPHVVLTVRTAEGREYRVEWWNTARLRRVGLTENTFSVGDVIVLTGAAHRNPEVLELALLTEVSRPADGWIWRRTRFWNRGAAAQGSAGR